MRYHRRRRNPLHPIEDVLYHIKDIQPKLRRDIETHIRKYHRLYQEVERAYESGNLDRAEDLDAELDDLECYLDDILTGLEEDPEEEVTHAGSVVEHGDIEDTLSEYYLAYKQGRVYASHSEFAEEVRNVLLYHGADADKVRSATDNEMWDIAKDAYNRHVDFVSRYKGPGEIPDDD